MSDPLFTIIKYSHYFKLNVHTPRIQHIVNQYISNKLVLKTFIKKPAVGFVMTPSKIFAAKTKGDSEYRFHINQLPDFIHYLDDIHVSSNLYKITEASLPVPKTVEINIQDGWELRDYQVPVYNYLITNNSNLSKMVALKTGRGKTFTTLMAISTLKMRTVILIKPMYIEKWCSDVLKITDCNIGDLMTVSGSSQLKGLISLANNDALDAKIIIISARTFQNYIDSYEQTPYDFESTGYECAPDAFYETIQAGVLLMDEVHQEFYANFRALLYTHIPLTISLSATLFNDNYFIEKMYDLAYPKPTRYLELDVKNYIKSRGISYRFNDISKIRTTEYGSTVYSHHAFEKSILKNHKILDNYLALIDWTVQYGYLKEYMPGDKLAIYASSIALCTVLTQYLKNKYPHLDVRRYVEDDPYENVIDADIRCTTILSAGTAIDIPNLRCTILTINVFSVQSNIQTLGRLRELKDRDVKFFYLWCSQIPKHNSYHRRRMQLLKENAASLQQYDYHLNI